MRLLRNLLTTTVLIFSLSAHGSAQDPGWHRKIVKAGETLSVYQPQVDPCTCFTDPMWRKAFQLTPTGACGNTAAGKTANGDMYAGHDGNVHSDTGSGWQRYDNSISSWNNVNTSKRSNASRVRIRIANPASMFNVVFDEQHSSAFKRTA